MVKVGVLVIDVQNDFLPGGGLAVKDGDRVIDPTNRLIAEMKQRDGFVVASKDWHPANHGSFASVAGKDLFSTFELNGLEQVAWPDHCVQGTEGADFAPGLNAAGIDTVVTKGSHPEIDSYSAFFDNARRSDTGLDAILKDKGIDTVVLVGLTTDYCVKFSALDALSLGYRVIVVAEGCRAVGGEAAHNAALDEVRRAGGLIAETVKDAVRLAFEG